MGKVNLAVEGYKLRQTGEQVQKILDAVELLNIGDTKELLELLKDIKEYDNSDDEQDIGHQLVNALNNMVSEKEVQTGVNNSTYPPSSQAVKTAIADEARIREIQDNQLAQDLHTETGARINGDRQLRSEISQAENRLSSVISQVREDTTLDDSLSLSSVKGVKNQVIARAINEINKLLYRRTKEIKTYPLRVTQPFDLKFKCTSYDYSLVPRGTWTCSDIEDIYKYITYDGNSLSKHSADVMRVSSIAVSDSYLEDNQFEVYIDINLNPNDIDNYPVGALMSADSQQVYYNNGIYPYPTYPYVMFQNNSRIRVALGCIVLPDDGVVVGGSELTLSVPAADLGEIQQMIDTIGEPIVGDISELGANETIIGKLMKLPSGGTWHYGTELTHTQETVQNNSIKAVKGDFYLNTEHFHVYYTQNGTGDWIYIGNLRGSVDTSKWASINSPNFTGVPTAPTPSTTNNSTQIATTEFVRDAIEQFGEDNIDLRRYAPLESPIFTGIPTAPTADINTNNTQIATTEFVVKKLKQVFFGINMSSKIEVSAGRAVGSHGSIGDIVVFYRFYDADDNLLEENSGVITTLKEPTILRWFLKWSKWFKHGNNLLCILWFQK